MRLVCHLSEKQDFSPAAYKGPVFLTQKKKKIEAGVEGVLPVTLQSLFFTVCALLAQADSSVAQRTLKAVRWPSREQVLLTSLLGLMTLLPLLKCCSLVVGPHV